MRDRVAAHLQPGATAAAVVPKLLHLAGDIVAQIDVVVDGFLPGIGTGALRLCVAQIGELAVLARAAEWTGYAHLVLAVLNAGWVGRPGPFRRSSRRGGSGPAGSASPPCAA